MLTDLRQMSGEELLLVSVLGGAKVQPAVDRELDRRTLLGPVRRLRRSEERWAALKLLRVA